MVNEWNNTPVLPLARFFNFWCFIFNLWIHIVLAVSKSHEINIKLVDFVRVFIGDAIFTVYDPCSRVSELADNKQWWIVINFHTCILLMMFYFSSTFIISYPILMRFDIQSTFIIFYYYFHAEYVQPILHKRKNSFTL